MTCSKRTPHLTVRHVHCAHPDSTVRVRPDEDCATQYLLPQPSLQFTMFAICVWRTVAATSNEQYVESTFHVPKERTSSQNIPLNTNQCSKPLLTARRVKAIISRGFSRGLRDYFLRRHPRCCIRPLLYTARGWLTSTCLGCEDDSTNHSGPALMALS